LAERLEDLAPAGLVERARRAADLVDGVSRVRVFCHYDPDGTTSAAILARALMRRGRRFHASMSHAFDRAALERLRAEENELLIVSDMGSGQLDLIEQLPGPTIVLDHHKPLRDSEKVVHVNAHLFGVDGARDVCGATTTWLFAIALDEANWDLAGIALAGAIGDKQDVGGFSGLNAKLVEEALERKVVVRERAIALRDLPAAEAVARSVTPYFRGLAGRPDAAEAFLRSARVDPAASVRQMEPAARRALTSALASRLVRQGAAPEALDVLVSDRYWIEPDQMYAGDLEAVVNGCDRLDQEGLGMAVLLGDREALGKAEALRDEYDRLVLGHLVRLESDGLFAKKHVQFFYCEEPTLAGAVAGIGMPFFFDQSKASLGLSVMDGVTKVSARGTRAQVASGLDLAAALREAAAAVGGNGGGHDIASGATIPKGKEDRFIALVDEIVGRQRAGTEQAAQ
jgi:RecJ-like exonuclease